jgi:dihydropyrimidine dehydrogenase (NAD+) subunit PreA
MKQVELSIDFCGVKFANPFIVAASPSTHSGDMVRRAFDHGWSGVVWKTLGAIAGVNHPKVSPCYAHKGWNEQLQCFENIDLGNDVPLEQSFREISEVKRDYPGSVLIISIRGENDEGKWKELSKRAEDAGADMLELMFSCPHDIADSQDGEGEIGRRAKAITAWVRETVYIPIMVKMSPNVTDIRIPARAAKAGGADAISATNTIRSILGIDLKTLRPLPTVGGMSAFGGYSGPAIKPIILRMVAELARDPKLGLPLSAIGGVVSWMDAVEYMLLGATTVQVGTATMFYGFRMIDDLLSAMENFLREKGFSSVAELIGLSLPYITTQPSLDREYRVKVKLNLDKCIRCLRCYVACQDGAYMAIDIGPERTPIVLEEECQGCSLCTLVCPVDGAMEMVPAKSKRGEGKGRR